MGKKRGGSSAVNVLFGWVRRRSVKVKTFIGVTIGLCAFLALWFFVENHNHLFIASEAIHAAGILVLIHKLTTQRTCSGLSLRSQELTALFLAVRMALSAIMEANAHTVLDLATLISTAWVIYMMRFKLKSSYIKELDNIPLYYIVVPCAILAVLVHPHTLHWQRSGMFWAFRAYLESIFWAFCAYLESVSVLPQLRLMQNAKMIEPFTAHYVFALGIARFLSCAHWIIMVCETRGSYILMAGSGYSWYLAAFIAEMVQTFILADFCFYYVKSVMQGQLLLKMPV